jgi:hypothetical protein
MVGAMAVQAAALGVGNPGGSYRLRVGLRAAMIRRMLSTQIGCSTQAERTLNVLPFGGERKLVRRVGLLASPAGTSSSAGATEVQPPWTLMSRLSGALGKLRPRDVNSVDLPQSEMDRPRNGFVWIVYKLFQ